MASSTAVAPANLLNPQEITALLRNSGMVEGDQGGGNEYIKVEGTTFYLGDEMFVGNPKTGSPAFMAQIVEPPKMYQARWFTEDDALAVNRPDIADSMCRSWFDEPSQARDFAEDGTDCRKCPVNPFVKRANVPDWAREGDNVKKCAQRADLALRIYNPETGTVASPQVYILRLPFTSIVEWQGLRDAPEAGHAGKLNFMHLLANLAQEQATESGQDPTQAILQAMTALRLGGVIAEVRAVSKQSQDKSRSYYVTQLTPVKILDVQESPALPSSDSSEGTAVEDDDIPF